MEQIRHGAGPQRSASSRVNGSAVPARPLSDTIDLSGPAFYSDSFAVGCGGKSGRTTELRIGEAQDYFFVRVKSDGMMMELSSGLLHEGVRCETWHGVASGDCVNGPLLLQCALKFDGETFKLDLRVQGGKDGCDTLIYGSSRFEGAALGSTAEVGLHRVTEDETLERPASANGANGQNGNGNGNGNSNSVARPVRRSASSVRFCPSDSWYEYEVPAPIRTTGGA